MIELHTLKNDRIGVVSPYHPILAKKARAIGGKWAAVTLPDGKVRDMWTFPSVALDNVQTLCEESYGVRALDPATPRVHAVTVEYFEQDDSVRGAVLLAGYVVASAHGRDSGAFPGADVVYTKGSPKSGGSAANWLSIVPKGSKVTLLNVPVAYVDYLSRIEEPRLLEVQDAPKIPTAPATVKPVPAEPAERPRALVIPHLPVAQTLSGPRGELHVNSLLSRTQRCAKIVAQYVVDGVVEVELTLATGTPFHRPDINETVWPLTGTPVILVPSRSYRPVVFMQNEPPFLWATPDGKGQVGFIYIEQPEGSFLADALFLAVQALKQAGYSA